MGDRVPGLRTGELAGVILRVAPEPGILLFEFHGVLAITSTIEFFAYVDGRDRSNVRLINRGICYIIDLSWRTVVKYFQLSLANNRNCASEFRKGNWNTIDVGGVSVNCFVVRGWEDVSDVNNEHEVTGE